MCQKKCCCIALKALLAKIKGAKRAELPKYRNQFLERLKLSRTHQVAADRDEFEALAEDVIIAACRIFPWRWQNDVVSWFTGQFKLRHQNKRDDAEDPMRWHQSYRDEAYQFIQDYLNNHRPDAGWQVGPAAGGHGVFSGLYAEKYPEAVGSDAAKPNPPSASAEERARAREQRLAR